MRTVIRRGVVAVTLALATTALATSAWPASASTTRCDGRVPTIVGTDGNDRIRGTLGPDVILARGGDDLVYGFGGDDVVCGGQGADKIYGQGGEDRLFGDQPRVSPFHGDLLDGGRGDDLLDLSAPTSQDQRVGAPLPTFPYRLTKLRVRVDLATGTATGQGHDRLVLPPPASRATDYPDIEVIGSLGNDTILGSANRDKLIGGRADDTLRGRAGGDFLKGQTPHNLFPSNDRNVVDGGAGADRILSLAGPDMIEGGPGADFIQATTSAPIDLHRGLHIDAGRGNDRVDEAVSRRPGQVTEGGPGRDHLRLSLTPPPGYTPDAAFAFDQATAVSTLTETDGTKVTGLFSGFAVFDLLMDAPVTFIGDAESSTLTSFSSALDAAMGPGDDVVQGSPLDDHLDGGDGNDRVVASLGTDTCVNFEVGTCG